MLRRGQATLPFDGGPVLVPPLTPGEREAFAAAELSRTAVWRAGAAWLDVRLLLSSELTCAGSTVVLFDVDAEEVRIGRHLLRGARRGLRFKDLAAFVDERGLHFRWRMVEGRYRGGWNIPSYPYSDELVVRAFLHRPVRAA